MESSNMHHQGTVVRISDLGLAFIADGCGRNLCFRFDKIQGYKGEHPSDIGLTAGRQVRFSTSDSEQVVEVELLPQ